MNSLPNNSIPQCPNSSVSTPNRIQTSEPFSSAFGVCASPSEDWTKISDFEERRRIQSRIAQRNYRKKQKKRLEQAEKRIEPIPELAYEELATPESPSDLSLTDTQQNQSLNVYNNWTSESLQQYLSSSDDCIVPLQEVAPEISTAQSPIAQASTPVCPSFRFYNGAEQQPSHNSYNGCAPPVPQEQYQASEHSCSIFPKPTNRQYSNWQTLDAYTVTSEHTACHLQPDAQPQRMCGFYESVPSHVAWPSSEYYTRASCGPFEQSCRSSDFSPYSPLVHSSYRWRPYMTLPPPARRGCCCHHHHDLTHPQGPSHAVSMLLTQEYEDILCPRA